MHILVYMVAIAVLSLCTTGSPSTLGFPADNRTWVATWFDNQTFVTNFRSEYRKMVHGGVVEKAGGFLLKKTDFSRNLNSL